ncbi:hypothetical protein NHX12_004821 [Muraenolepis orangiensis]|uniref:Uncharacterized protein n=1 Tax=Muraenolepis orangiensis TaxID=630683 RepID=A0A9Q0DXV1_9TELE|nr:hypothetical protein NHX12_004821 [Muraenolepis orangiensis]
MFAVLQKFMEERQLPWDRMVGFCTDGAPSMAGRRAGLRTLIMDVSPSAIWTHCMIHREQLAAKELSVALADVLQQLCKFLTDNSIADQCPAQTMIDHLKCLEEHVTTYFPGLDMSKFDWVIDPFLSDAGSVDLPASAIEQLIELSCDRTLKGLHSRVSVEEFWFGARG